MRKEQLNKILLLAKPYSGKFIFRILLIIFAVIILHIFPIKVIIDTRPMYRPDDSWAKKVDKLHFLPPLKVNADVGEVEVINR